MNISSFQAVFENGVLRPLEPLALAEHAVVSLAIVPAGGSAGSADPADAAAQSHALEDWLDQASRLPPEGPVDGLSNRAHDQILYGKPA